MDRHTIWNAVGIAVLVVSPLAIAGCGDDDDDGGAGGGGGAPPQDGAPSDASGGSIGDGAGSDRALPDSWIPPSGSKLVSGDHLSLLGVTDDDYAVYRDEANGTLQAISLSGGAPIFIGSAGAQISIQGLVVVQWGGMGPVAPLSVWTSSYGVQSLSEKSLASERRMAVSADGSRILFFNDVDEAATIGNLWIASVDGIERASLATGIALDDPSCPPVLALGGSSAASAAFCWSNAVPKRGATDGGPDEPSPDASSIDDAGRDALIPAAAVVQSFRAPDWTASTLATGVLPHVAVAATGESVLVGGPAGLVVYPFLGGAGTTVDEEGVWGRFTKDGLSVIYTTRAHALKRSTIASPAPVVLVESGFAGIRAISPDDNWVLGYETIDLELDLSDLYLTSAAAPGPVTTLSASPTAGLFRSDGFTTDSTRALCYTNVSNGLGTLISTPSAGGTPAVLAMGTWMHFVGSEAYVVFNNDYDPATQSAEIRAANAAQTISSVIVSLADAEFHVNGIRDKVVYTWKYVEGDMAGLWVQTIPYF
jgi:hypothetical protein